MNFHFLAFSCDTANLFFRQNSLASNNFLIPCTIFWAILELMKFFQNSLEFSLFPSKIVSRFWTKKSINYSKSIDFFCAKTFLKFHFNLHRCKKSLGHISFQEIRAEFRRWVQRHLPNNKRASLIISNCRRSRISIWFTFTCNMRKRNKCMKAGFLNKRCVTIVIITERVIIV